MYADRVAENARLRLLLQGTKKALVANGVELGKLSDDLACQEAKNASMRNEVVLAHETTQNKYGES